MNDNPTMQDVLRHFYPKYLDSYTPTASQAKTVHHILNVGQRIEGDANDKLFFRPLKNRPRSLGANGRLTAIIRHIIGEY